MDAAANLRVGGAAEVLKVTCLKLINLLNLQLYELKLKLVC